MFGFSTEAFGGDRSRPVLERLLALVGIHLPDAVVNVIHTMMRKTAHVGEYAILSLLVYRAIAGRLGGVWRHGAARSTLLFCALYSLTDEFHQSFVRNRGASLVDCGLDVFGVTLGLLLIYRVIGWTQELT
jgi:VanZ family protein